MRKLPKIRKGEFRKYDKRRSFDEQRKEQVKLGASEIGSILLGHKDFIKAVAHKTGLVRFLKTEQMEKGKLMEDLSFTFYSRKYKDEIAGLYSNKYKNGVDCYNYFKTYKGMDAPIGSTIDGWIAKRDGAVELLELKYSENTKYASCIRDYNRYGNPLGYKYFFAIYAQAQAQMANTGINTCNVFFTMSSGNKRCVIARNEAFIDKMFTIAYEFLSELPLYKEMASDILASKSEGEYIDTLSEMLHAKSKLYQTLCDPEYDYKKEFATYIPRKQLVVNENQANVLEGLLARIDTLEKDAKRIMDTQVQAKKDEAKELQELLKLQFPFIDGNSIYQTGDIIFTFTTDRYTNILDRLNIIGVHPSIKPTLGDTKAYAYAFTQEELDALNAPLETEEEGLTVAEEKEIQEAMVRKTHRMDELGHEVGGDIPIIINDPLVNNVRVLPKNEYRIKNAKGDSLSLLGTKSATNLSNTDDYQHNSKGEVSMSYAEDTRSSEEIRRDRIIEHAKLQIKKLIKRQVRGGMPAELNKEFMYEMAEAYNVDPSFMREVPLQDMALILKVYPLLKNKKDYNNNINYYISAWEGVRRNSKDELEQFRQEELCRIKEEAREKQKEQELLEAIKGEMGQAKQHTEQLPESEGLYINIKQATPEEIELEKQEILKMAEEATKEQDNYNYYNAEVEQVYQQGQAI
ncbi:DUF244 domain-containing protein [Candidatus Borreliella tachyglossi]|uniref:DUF244 domain-containing protein n=1 Tax=Candidatus Borreliella tachyglossi TaxID=1964448 RepID=UPI00404376FF